MKVVVKKRVIHGTLGRLDPGRVVEVPEPWASRWLAAGAVERYETKVVRDNPLPVAGAAVPLSASPAGPASPPKTSKPSGDGEKPERKRRGRSS